jgi:hypothetical protein
MQKGGLSSIRRNVLLPVVTLVTTIACGSQSEFAQSAAASFSTATSNISKAFGDDGDDYRHQLVSGDFNGDGYLDNAYAGVVGIDNWTLVVHLDVLNDDGGDIVLLDQHTPDVPVDEIRLETRPPGTYRTFCGYAPEECEPDIPGELSLSADGILLVVIEASASIVYWDVNTSTFERIWLTD